MPNKPMSRWKAATIHLALSILVLGTVAAFVLLLWYPSALLTLSGVDRLIGLIAAVDLTVGPLLTLIVYRHGKPGLRLDLTLIAVVQLVLLGYGLSVLAKNRPVYLVGVVDRLELVTAKELSETDLAAAPPEYRTLSWTGARLVGAPLPTDLGIRSQLLADAAEGRDIHAQPRYYTAFSYVQGELLLHAMPVASLLAAATPTEQEALNEALEGQSVDDIRYLALHAEGGDVVALIGTAGELLKFVAVDPREIEARATTAP